MKYEYNKVTLVEYKQDILKWFFIEDFLDVTRAAYGFFNVNDIEEFLDNPTGNLETDVNQILIHDDMILSFAETFDGDEFALFEQGDSESINEYIENFINNNVHKRNYNNMINR